MYKWTVYLNNKCSKEQPQAWSVVRKCKNDNIDAPNLEEMSTYTPKK